MQTWNESMLSLSRREFVGGSAGLAAAALASPGGMAPPLDALARPAGPLAEVARDERYWERVAKQFRLTATITNLENGYWGVMAQPVFAAYSSHLARVNTEGVPYIRTAYVQHLEAARARVATALGVSADE